VCGTPTQNQVDVSIYDTGGNLAGSFFSLIIY
jgi:hypothetical protein